LPDFFFNSADSCSADEVIATLLRSALGNEDVWNAAARMQNIGDGHWYY